MLTRHDYAQQCARHYALTQQSLRSGGLGRSAQAELQAITQAIGEYIRQQPDPFALDAERFPKTRQQSLFD
jgi:hypothetical protein